MASKKKPIRTERGSVSPSKRKASVLFAQNPLPMLIYDLKTMRFLEVNASAAQQYGYDREEFLKLSLNDIRQPNEGAEDQDHADEGILDSDKASIHVRKDGV